MNNNNKLDRTMPATEHDFQIDVIGSATGKRFLGEFTCKIPTIKDQCQSARHEAFLNGENGPFLPSGILKVNKMIAYLRFTLIEVPKFWKVSDLGYELRDANVVEEVYNAVLKFEDSWVSKVWGDPTSGDKKEDIEDTGSDTKN